MYIDRRIFIRIVSFLCAIIVVLTGVCIYTNYQKNNFVTALSNDYIASFDELSSHMYNIETAFYKGIYSNSPYQMVKMATKVWGEAMAAKTNIESMYGYTNELSQVSEFLSKSSDYVYYTALKMIKNEEVTAQDTENLVKLANTASDFSQRINEISQKLNSGEIQYDEITFNTVSGENFSSETENLSSNLVSSSDQVTGYPELIYDGPFSDHIEKRESVFLSEKGEISREEAQNRICDWFDVSKENIEYIYDNNSKIESYVFNVNDFTVAISKQGGYLVEAVSATLSKENNITADDAIKSAFEFLNKTGFENMKENYYYSLGNELTVNFAYFQNGITVYPDLIKVTVSLETGNITGFEGLGYLMAHTDARDTQTGISVEEAREKVNPMLSVFKEGIAIIPTDGKNEVLCYEFQTKAKDGRKVLVYINAKNGVEEMLQILIENENGTLAG